MDLSDDDLTPEQRRMIDALHVEFEQQLVRLNVDFRAASPQMHEQVAPQRRHISGDEESYTFEMSFTIDVSGILDTLRRLPDGAGTEAFVAAYNATHPDWRGPDTER